MAYDSERMTPNDVGSGLRPDADARRTLVTQLSWHMARKLDSNATKGGWRGVAIADLIARLREEVEELEAVCHNTDVHDDAVWAEAADVANFAAMIADACGAQR